MRKLLLGLFTLITIGLVAQNPSLPIDMEDPADDAWVGDGGCVYSLETVLFSPDKVGKIEGGGDQWNSRVDLALGTYIDMTTANKTFTFDFYTSTAEVMTGLLQISLEKDAGFAIEMQFTTDGAIGWQTIELDFIDATNAYPNAGLPVVYGQYAQISIFTNFGSTDIGTYYFDDISGAANGGLVGEDPAPVTQPIPQPSAAEEDVVSVFSDVYTDLETTWHPAWGQTTIYSDEIIEGTSPEDHVSKLKNFGYEGITFTSTSVAEMEFVHFDVWSYDETSMKFFLLAPAGNEPMVQKDLDTESWNSFNIPLSEFVGGDLSAVEGIKLESGTWTYPNGTSLVYIDNVYFWRNPVNPAADATLSDLMVDEETVDGFSPSILSYTVELPFGTTEIPAVTAVPNNSGAEVVINPTIALPGTTYVVVTSEDETNTLTYSVEFTLAGQGTTSDYCETEVFHFAGDPPSVIYLTITNVDATSMMVEIESADDDPVDVLLVLGGSGATISDPNTSVPGKISRTLTWAATPPTDVELNVLWSKESFPGNWALAPGGESITVPFEANCDGPSNTLAFDPQDGATDVEVTVSPTLTFSTAIEMAGGGEITNGDIAGLVTFKETDASGADVPYVGTINAEKTVITIDPVEDLAGDQVYYLALGDEVIQFQDGDLIPGESITFTTEVGVKPYLALDVQDNFEDDGWGTIDDWKFQDSDILVDLTVIPEPGNPSNHVADYNRSGAFLYTNAQFILDHRMDLTQRNKFELKVYFPSSNDYTGGLTPTAAIKLQNSLLGGNAWTTQTEVNLDVTEFDQWVTLTFDFIAAADRDDYDQVVVQLGGEAHNVPGQFYFDDIELLPVQSGPNADFSATPTSGFAPLTVQFTNLSTGGLSVWAWDFENDGVVDSNEENPSHTYDAPGSYSVKLQIGNVFNGDIEIKENYIVVSELVEPPYIYTDFDDNVNHTFEGWPNMPETIANPDPSGINVSDSVGQWARSTEPYANVYSIFENTINFSEGSIFTLQVWAPIECEVLFKLESTLTGQSTQRFANVSAAEEWQLLGFDFTGEQSDVYDNIIIFFDFENDIDNLFFFDDIRGPEPNGQPLYKPLLALDVQDNFEDDGYSTIDQWYFQDPDLVPLNVVEDPVNAANHVADYDRSGSFEWTNAQFILDHRMDLSERNIFEVKVYSPAGNAAKAIENIAAIKLQNSLLGEFAYTTEKELISPIGVYDEWVTLQFDFSEIADSVNYDQVVVQLGGQGHFDPGQFYFDDFMLLDAQFPYMQVIELSEGWSGISSNVVPANSNIEDMLEPIIEDVEIIVGTNGFYHPASGTNTLVNWYVDDGYIVKMSAANQLEIAGNELAPLSLEVPAGWSALPVQSSCAVSVQDLVGSLTEVIMIKDVAGTMVYWPEKEIYDLETLQQGVAYYILTSAVVTVTFPECTGDYTLIWSDEFDGTEVNTDN